MVNFAQKLNQAAEVNSRLTRLYWKLLTNTTTTDTEVYSNLSNRYKLFASVKNLTYSHYEVGGGSSTVMHVRIPNYFQAILTIFICVIIMSTTICVIVRTKYWCTRYMRNRARNGQGSAVGLNEVKILRRGGSPVSSTCESMKNDKSDPARSPATPQNGIRHFPNGYGPRGAQMVRRFSGPFTDDVLEFAHESYKQKKQSMKLTVNGGNGKPVTKLVVSTPIKRERLEPTLPPTPEESSASEVLSVAV